MCQKDKLSENKFGDKKCGLCFQVMKYNLIKNKSIFFSGPAHVTQRVNAAFNQVHTQSKAIFIKGSKEFLDILT